MFDDVKKILFKESEAIPHFDFVFNIQESNRKTISLIIKDGKLIVRCPFFTKKIRIYNLLKKKENWIKKHISKQKENSEKLENNYKKNNIFLYKGKEKKLRVKKNKKIQVKVTSKEILIFANYLDINSHKKILTNWYKEKSLIFFQERIRKFSKIMNLDFKKLLIIDVKTKWGKCSYFKKIIYLNWRLIMAPVSILDYVIIHELSHLRFPNHSKLFWKEVGRFKPNFKEDQKWLKENGFILFF